MDNDLAQIAIASALSGDWKKAQEINLKILKENPHDVDALNRLSRAYFELGSIKKAKVTAQKVIKLDPFNSIAKKSLDKWKELKKIDKQDSIHLSPQNFIEEPGKTKNVFLMHLGDPKVLAKLDAGDIININTHCHRISITTSDNKYVGRLADDLSSKLRKLTNLGYQYTAAIKSINKNEVKIFIREVIRPAKFKDTPSFSSEKIEYISYTPPELVHKKEGVAPDFSETEEVNE